MPANLTPDYLAADKRFREAETTEDKLAALEEMYATIPKHKGTEKLQADIKRRISKLRDKEKRLAKKGKRHDDFHVVKQGAGQIVLLGPSELGQVIDSRPVVSGRARDRGLPVHDAKTDACDGGL